MKPQLSTRIRIAAAALLLAIGSPAHAYECKGGWFEFTCERFKDAFDHGEHDFYFPFLAYHARSNYTPDKIASFNERPGGFGYGRSVISERGDWHGFYGMAFSDSHNNREWLAGYGYQTYWGGADALQAGFGYTAFLTSRHDIAAGFPVPGILPMASLRYKKFSVMGSYVPRISNHKGNGDVLFLFTRISF